MAPGQKGKELRHLGRAVPLALAFVLAMGAVALADNLTDALVAGGGGTTISIQEGQSFTQTISYSVQQTGGNNTTLPATVNFGFAPVGASSVPSWASLSAASLTFTGYSSVQQLTVSGIAPAGSAGTYEFNVDPTTSAPRLNTSPAERKFVITVTPPPAPGDTTPPVISYTVNPSSPDGDNGWYRSNVTLTWTVTEAESPGSLIQTGCMDQNIISDQEETTYSCSATSDGGSTGPVSVSIKRDATAPTLSCNAASFLLNQPDAVVEASISDVLSGPLTAMASAPADTSSAGINKTVTITGYDMAGNSAEADCSYSVGYTFDGLYAPVDRPNTLNVSKAGQAIPLKWRLTDYFGQGVSHLAAVNVTATSMSCSLGTTTDALEEYASGSSGLQNLGDGYYQFNWKTPTTYANSCKSLSIKMGTASSNAPAYMNLANFQFKK